MPDEGILRRRTWIVVGVIFGLLAVVVMAGVIMQPVISHRAQIVVGAPGAPT